MNNIIYYHDRYFNPRKPEEGITTFAISTLGNALVYAVSQCNPKDQFCKKTGRIKATGRLKSPRYRRIVIDSAQDLDTISGRKAAIHIATDNFYQNT